MVIANKTSKYVFQYQDVAGEQHIRWTDTVDGAPAGNAVTLTDTDMSNCAADTLAGYILTGLTGDNIGTEFTIVTNTAADPTVVTLSGTPVTPADLAADTVEITKHYRFGSYNDKCGKWNSHFVEQKYVEYTPYAQRTPNMIDADSEFPIFKHVFLPTSCQPFAWMLKLPATATPMTIVALETGLGHPMTIRLEQLGGTEEKITQTVDNYCVGLLAVAERGEELIVETTFAFGELQDQSTLTKFTDLPSDPAGMNNGVKGTYEGNPEVKWDIGGHNTEINGCWKAEWLCEQDWGAVPSNDGDKQTVYTYKYKPVKITLNVIFELQDAWEDYFARKANTNMTIVVYKHDRTHKITATFTNCKIIKAVDTGIRNEGHYASVMNIEAEKVEYTSNWLAEYDGADADWALHFKAGV